MLAVFRSKCQRELNTEASKAKAGNFCYSDKLSWATVRVRRRAIECLYLAVFMIHGPAKGCPRLAIGVGFRKHCQESVQESILLLLKPTPSVFDLIRLQ